MTDVKDYLKKIGLAYQPTKSSNNSYVIDLIDSDDYGKVYSKLENCEDLEPLQDNQVLTEKGGSTTYESITEPYIFTLIADWDGDIYQLVINTIDK